MEGDDLGRFEFTRADGDEYAFRTPTLRNVARTAPYMHDGVFSSLEEVVRFYDSGGLPRHPAVPESAIDPRLRQPLGLTDAEIQALVAFMEALTDEGSGVDPMLLTVPDRVPSGLTPVTGLSSP